MPGTNVEAGRILDGDRATPRGETYGLFIVKRGGAELRIISSGEGCGDMGETGLWEHVSVSLRDRTPTWAELEWGRRKLLVAYRRGRTRARSAFLETRSAGEAAYAEDGRGFSGRRTLRERLGAA